MKLFNFEIQKCGQILCAHKPYFLKPGHKCVYMKQCFSGGTGIKGPLLSFTVTEGDTVFWLSDYSLYSHEIIVRCVTFSQHFWW